MYYSKQKSASKAHAPSPDCMICPGNANHLLFALKSHSPEQTNLQFYMSGRSNSTTIPEKRGGTALFFMYMTFLERNLAQKYPPFSMMLSYRMDLYPFQTFQTVSANTIQI